MERKLNDTKEKKTKHQRRKYLIEMTEIVTFGVSGGLQGLLQLLDGKFEFFFSLLNLLSPGIPRDFGGPKLLGTYESGKFIPLGIPNMELKGLSISKDHEENAVVIILDANNLVRYIVVH